MDCKSCLSWQRLLWSAAVSLKCLKNSSHSGLLWFHALTVLQKSLSIHAVTELLSKDVVKQMKSALSHKCYAFEKLEGADQLTQHPLTQWAGYILASTQVQKSPPLQDTSKKIGNNAVEAAQELFCCLLSGFCS